MKKYLLLLMLASYSIACVAKGGCASGHTSSPSSHSAPAHESVSSHESESTAHESTESHVSGLAEHQEYATPASYEDAEVSTCVRNNATVYYILLFNGKRCEYDTITGATKAQLESNYDKATGQSTVTEKVFCIWLLCIGVGLLVQFSIIFIIVKYASPNDEEDN